MPELSTSCCNCLIQTSIRIAFCMSAPKNSLGLCQVAVSRESRTQLQLLLAFVSMRLLSCCFGVDTVENRPPRRPPDVAVEMAMTSIQDLDVKFHGGNVLRRSGLALLQVKV